MISKVNVISALINLHERCDTKLSDQTTSYNRINDVGAGLESYVKDLFYKPTKFEKASWKDDYFSYEGGKNNPPDLILRHGDAFEIKKIETMNSTDIQLNSSFPKGTLSINDPKLTEDCKNCEEFDWKEKDFFYVIGIVSKSIVKSLFFIQGVCLAAPYEHYDKIFQQLKDYIADSSFKFTETKELGRINKIDHLGFTNLRIRPMVLLKNPYKIFDFCKIEPQKDLSVFCLMTDIKYSSLAESDRKILEELENVTICEKVIGSPKDPGQYLKCKFIKFFK